MTARSNRGSLRNGNPPGDPDLAARCGARTRAGTACRAPALRGRRRCRLHGGLSTGPRTPEGLQRSRRARWKHGGYSWERRVEHLHQKAECRAFTAMATVRHAVLMAAAKTLLDPLEKERRNERRREKRAIDRWYGIGFRKISG